MDTNLTDVSVVQTNRYEGSVDGLVQRVNDRGLHITSGGSIDPAVWTPENIDKLKTALQHVRDSEQRIKGGQG